MGMGMRYVYALPLAGVADLGNVFQRWPISLPGLYGIETTLMALDGLGGAVAFAAMVTRRRWSFAAWTVWALLAIIRVLGVGHLQ